MNGEDNAYNLLMILQSYAPDGIAQQKCANAYNEAIADGTTGNKLVALLAGYLIDGLTYGNWLWI